MVSEDSQDFGWFPVIHRLLDLRDLDDPGDREVSPHLHQLDDPVRTSRSSPASKFGVSSP